MTIRLLVVDDHQVMREGLCALLASDHGVDVVGQADNGDAAIQMALDLGPDVVLMDVSLPGVDGIEAVRRITRERPDIRCVMLTMFDDQANVGRSLRAGARGYVLKDAGADTVLHAVREVQAGNVFISPAVAAFVVQGFLAGSEAAPLDPLSDREREVVRLVAEGNDSRQIGELLGLKMKTVQNHRTRIMEKLGLQTTAGLVRYAFRAGISR
jgi:DNA-binding NarL/FixJ family response regulator